MQNPQENMPTMPTEQRDPSEPKVEPCTEASGPSRVWPAGAAAHHVHRERAKALAGSGGGKSIRQDSEPLCCLLYTSDAADEDSPV